MFKRFLSVAVCAVVCTAQDFPIFPKPSYFKTYFKSPVTQVELQNPVRLEDFVVDGKLELSLKSYLELVLRNNSDITIKRLLVDPVRNARFPCDPGDCCFRSSPRSTAPKSRFPWALEELLPSPWQGWPWHMDELVAHPPLAQAASSRNIRSSRGR
jgi:hypothetical protein